VVEDHVQLAHVAVRQLGMLGYGGCARRSMPMRRLAILRGDAVIDLLFTDVVMPGDDGMASSWRARRCWLRPGLPVLPRFGISRRAGAGPAGGGERVADHQQALSAAADLARAVRVALGGEN